MSFILEALRRAERERRLERAPDLNSIYQEENLSRRGISPWFWITGFFLAGVVIVALVLWPRAESPSPPSSASETAARETTSSRPSPSAAKGPQTKALLRSAIVPTPVIAPDRKPGVPLGPGPLKKEKPGVIPPETPAPVPTVSRPEEVSKDPATADAGDPVAPGAQQPYPTARVDADVEVESPAPVNSVPLVNALPYEIREKLVDLEINVHAYSEHPSECFVFINMRNYKVGDRIGRDGPLLKKIVPRGVIIDYGEGQALLQVGK